MNSIPLGDLSIDEFLTNYWQKKPLLIRQAFPNFESPLEPDELAGLATQEGVLSRLILERGGEYPWQMRSGPFTEADFDQLSDEHWTILVQEVDRHVPAVADLFDTFNFLPGWRKDDVMVSFASKNAGVGAHIDSYDVFLLQGSGTRKWEIGEATERPAPADGGIRGQANGKRSEADPDYIPNIDVRILANFEATESWVLEPGDMLYLPPGVPHNGVSIDPCLTFSFGFLAPTRADMVGEFADWYQHRFGPTRYSDADLLERSSSGLITDNDLNRVLRLLQQSSIDRDSLAEWFGGFITRPQRGPADVEEFEGSFEDFLDDFEECGFWRRHEGVRVAAWVDGKPRLFVDGETIEDHGLDADTLTKFSESRQLTLEQAREHEALTSLLFQFTKRGWGYLLGDDQDVE